MSIKITSANLPLWGSVQGGLLRHPAVAWLVARMFMTSKHHP